MWWTKIARRLLSFAFLDQIGSARHSFLYLHIIYCRWNHIWENEKSLYLDCPPNTLITLGKFHIFGTSTIAKLCQKLCRYISWLIWVKTFEFFNIFLKTCFYFVKITRSVHKLEIKQTPLYNFERKILRYYFLIRWFCKMYKESVLGLDICAFSFTASRKVGYGNEQSWDNDLWTWVFTEVLFVTVNY